MNPLYMFVLLFFLTASAFGTELNLASDVAAPFGKDGQNVALVTENGENMIHLQWDSGKKKWAEFYWKKTFAESWEDFKDLRFRIKVRAGKATRPSGMMLRFVDRYGEVFAISGRIHFLENGTGCVDFTLPHDYKPLHTWKASSRSRKDGRIDYPVQLANIAVTYPSKAGKGELYITSIDVTEVPDAKTVNAVKTPPVLFDIYTGHPAHVVCPDKAKYCAVVLRNSSKKTVSFEGILTVRDLEGTLIGKTISISARISPGVRRYYRLPVPEKYGLYYVTLRMKTDGRVWKDMTRTFAYFEPVGHKFPYKKGQFRFGIQIHWGRQDMRVWETETEAMRTVGARFVRTDIPIRWIHGAKDLWSHNYFDGIMDYYKSQGLRFEIYCSGSAPWAAKNPADGKKSPLGNLPRPEVWQEYCEEFFRHYREHIHSFEIWNEPDLPFFALFSAEEFHELAKIAYQARNKYAPEAELMSPGFCTFDKKEHFHKNAMLLCRDLFDIHCFHGHGEPAVFKDVIDKKLLPMRCEIKIEKMPWYAHETALTSTGFGERKQAESLFKKLPFAWSRGSIGYTWYDLRNDGFNPSNPEHNYGLLTNDYYPKPVYVVYNTITSLLNGDTRFEADLSDDHGLSAFRFHRGNEFVFFVWNDRPGRISELVFRSNAKKAEIVDLWGNRHPAKRCGDLIFLPVGKSPEALHLSQADFCEQQPEIISAASKQIFLGGQGRIKTDLVIRNPLDHAVCFQICTESPAGLQIEKIPDQNLAAKSSKTFSVFIRSGNVKYTPSSSIRFRYTAGKELDGNVSFPINRLFWLPREYGSTPFAVLNRREQVVELFDADPGNVFRLWKGPTDLSAVVYAAADSKYFRLKVDAVDDKHCQPNHGVNIWKGDSLQVYCNFPGQREIWQFGCALQDNGKIDRYIWNPAAGFKPNLSVYQCKIARKGKHTVYELQIPWTAFGINPVILKKGFRFNLLLNESDSSVRESWIQLAPGVGNSVDPSAYPLLGWKPEK